MTDINNKMDEIKERIDWMQSLNVKAMGKSEMNRVMWRLDKALLLVEDAALEFKAYSD